jgi:hypothetical protein
MTFGIMALNINILSVVMMSVIMLSVVNKSASNLYLPALLQRTVDKTAQKDNFGTNRLNFDSVNPDLVLTEPMTLIYHHCNALSQALQHST